MSSQKSLSKTSTPVSNTLMRLSEWIITKFTRLVKLLLKITYPDSYPDVMPEMTISPTEGELETSEMDSLIDQLKSVVCLSLADSCVLAEYMHVRGRRTSGLP